MKKYRHLKGFALLGLFITVTSVLFTNFSLLGRNKDSILLTSSPTGRTPASTLFRPGFGLGTFTLTQPVYVNKRIDNIGPNPPQTAFTHETQKRIDFSGDGIPDSVFCSNNKFVQIIDGKTKKVFWEWAGPQIKHQGSNNLTLTSCDVVLLGNGHPAVFISSLWSVPGWFAPSVQHMVYKKSPTVIAVRPLVNNNTFGIYRASGRSVQCARYPQTLVNRGYKPGALCFYAGYLHEEKTHTALFKIDLDANKEPVFRDISASSGLLWMGGARGTEKRNLPRSQKCNGKGTTDGLFMMSGTFFDFNKDGLVDLMTVGQHASIRAHRMTFNANAAQGIRFVTTTVHQAGRGATQEFLRVTALNKFDPKITATCAHVSGEMYNGGSCGGGMKDQIICYNRTAARWERTNLPGPVSSEFVEPRAFLALDKKTVVLGIKKINTNSTYSNNYYRLFVGQ